jgi:hypothetical protein
MNELDRLIGGIHGSTSKRNAGEILQALWHAVGTQKNERTTGGHGRVFAQKILLSYLRKFKGASNTHNDLLLEGEKAYQEVLRSMWEYDKASSSPYRSESKKQHSVEHTNIVQELSRLLAYHSEKAWEAYCRENADSFSNPWYGDWERGTPRIATDASHRLHRLKGLGNAQVPLCAATAWRILYERINGEQ